VAEDFGEELGEEFQEEFGEEFGEESREAVGTREQRLKRNVSLMSMTSYVTYLYNSLFNAHSFKFSNGPWRPAKQPSHGRVPPAPRPLSRV